MIQTYNNERNTPPVAAALTKETHDYQGWNKVPNTEKKEKKRKEKREKRKEKREKKREKTKRKRKEIRQKR